jgi:hypothetical protein
MECEFFSLRCSIRLGKVIPNYKPSIWEAGVGGFWVLGQSGLHRETLTQKQKQNLYECLKLTGLLLFIRLKVLMCKVIFLPILISINSS